MDKGAVKKLLRGLGFGIRICLLSLIGKTARLGVFVGSSPTGDKGNPFLSESRWDGQRSVMTYGFGFSLRKLKCKIE